MGDGVRSPVLPISPSPHEPITHHPTPITHRPMTAYILRRLVMLVPVLIVVGVVVFGLVHLTPGDPAAVILGDRATPEDIARLRDQLGLNDPLPVQFVRWFSNVLRLDFGESIFLGEPVTKRCSIGCSQPCC